jgi:hypothetical protein
VHHVVELRSRADNGFVESTSVDGAIRADFYIVTNHQATDLLEHESHELITETSKATMATLMLLASSPSRITNLKVGSYSGTRAELTWTPSPEKGVASYIVAHGPVSDPMRHRVTVAQPRVTLQPIAPDTIVSVKAVNARGLEGWDWARVTVGSSTPRGAVSTEGRPGIQ